MATLTLLYRDQVRQYCEEKLMPRVLEANRRERESYSYVLSLNSAVTSCHRFPC